MNIFYSASPGKFDLMITLFLYPSKCQLFIVEPSWILSRLKIFLQKKNYKSAKNHVMLWDSREVICRKCLNDKIQEKALKLCHFDYHLTIPITTLNSCVKF